MSSVGCTSSYVSIIVHADLAGIVSCPDIEQAQVNTVASLDNHCSLVNYLVLFIKWPTTVRG